MGHLRTGRLEEGRCNPQAAAPGRNGETAQHRTTEHLHSTEPCGCGRECMRDADGDASRDWRWSIGTSDGAIDDCRSAPSAET